MKKFLKILLWVVVGVVVLVGLGALVIYLRGIPSYDRPEVTFTHESTPESVARGKKLADMLCVKCHMGEDGNTLTGKYLVEMPKEFGTIYSKNITSDKEYGIGDYTDSDLAILLRTGVRRDGVYTPPWMPKFPHASDADINAIISWLRSDDPRLAATNTPDKEVEPSMLSKFLATVAFKPLPYPETPIPEPDTSDEVAWGRYLVATIDCYGCHSEDFKTYNAMEPEKTPGYMGGGMAINNLEGEELFVANLTMDKETGIGNWTKEQFIKTVRFGQREGMPALRYPMEPFPQLSDEEVGAIYEYLKTIPKIRNQVDRKL